MTSSPLDRVHRHFSLKSTLGVPPQIESTKNDCSPYVPRKFYLPKVLEITPFFSGQNHLLAVFKVQIKLTSTLCCSGQVRCRL